MNFAPIIYQGECAARPKHDDADICGENNRQNKKPMISHKSAPDVGPLREDRHPNWKNHFDLLRLMSGY